MAKRTKRQRYSAFLSPSAIAILDLLERCSAICGPNLFHVFNDWLDLAEAVLDDLHAPWRALIAGTHAPLPFQATADSVWAHLAPRYQHPEACSLLSQACSALVAGAANQVYDDIGTVYMHACLGDAHRGQFFTPWNVCMMMATMNSLDGTAEIETRLAAAIAKSPDAQAAHAEGLHLTGDHAVAWRIARVLPHARRHIEPIWVIDNACGSGRMLLATSTQYPSWANALGLVSYVGLDVDPVCTHMARLNLKLFGLDGSQVGVMALRAEQFLARAARVATLRSIITDAQPMVIEALADVWEEIGTGSSLIPPWEQQK